MPITATHIRHLTNWASGDADLYALNAPMTQDVGFDSLEFRDVVVSTARGLGAVDFDGMYDEIAVLAVGADGQRIHRYAGFLAATRAHPGRGETLPTHTEILAAAGITLEGTP